MENYVNWFNTEIILPDLDPEEEYTPEFDKDGPFVFTFDEKDTVRDEDIPF